MKGIRPGLILLTLPDMTWVALVTISQDGHAAVVFGARHTATALFTADQAAL